MSKYRNKGGNKQAIVNLLANTYKRQGKYQDEISCLEDVLKFTQYHKQPSVYKRIAIAQFNLGEYQESKNTLARV